MQPKVSIVILNWNDWKKTIACLCSLFQSSYDNYEVILIDNGSTPDSLERIHDWLNGLIPAKTSIVPDNSNAKPIKTFEYHLDNSSQLPSPDEPIAKSLTIIRSEINLGFAGGCNLGIKFALKDPGGRYIMLLNNDMEVEPDMLGQLTVQAEKNTNAGAGQPKIMLSRSKGLIDAIGISISGLGFAKQIGHNEIDTGQYAHVREITGVCGGAAFLKKEMMENIGLFDEDFFAYYEDVDLSLRAQKAGWKSFYVPTAVVHHFHSASLGEDSPKKWYYLVRNSVYYVIKNFSVLKIALYLVFSYPLLIITSILRTGGSRDSFRFILRGAKEGLRGIPAFWAKRGHTHNIDPLNNPGSSINAPTRDNTAAVIVTFYPDDKFEEHLCAVIDQVNKIIIVDNNTVQSTAGDLFSRWEKKGCHVIRNRINLGVAAALNQGITWAIENNYQWILTLDQDTHIHAGLIDLYITAVTGDLAGTNVGVINTVYRDLNTQRMSFNPGIKKNTWSEVVALITSGSFFSTDTFKKVGPFREDYFLDWADHDFCLRARSLGLKNYIYPQALLDHTLGNKTEHKIFWGDIAVPTNNHSVLRCYLISRNLTILLKKYYFREIRWALYLTFYLIMKFILVVFFEGDKALKLKYLIKGSFDGILNKSSIDIIKKFQSPINSQPT